MTINAVVGTASTPFADMTPFEVYATTLTLILFGACIVTLVAGIMGGLDD